MICVLLFDLICKFVEIVKLRELDIWFYTPVDITKETPTQYNSNLFWELPHR